jgi:hypothetical protein
MDDGSFVVMSPALKSVAKHDPPSSNDNGSPLSVVAAELVACGRNLVLVMATRETSGRRTTASVHLTQLNLATDAGEHGPATELSATPLASHVLDVPSNAGIAGAADGGSLVGFACQPKSTSNFGLELALLWRGGEPSRTVLQFMRFADKPSGASLATVFKQAPTAGASLPLAVCAADSVDTDAVVVPPPSAVKRSARKAKRTTRNATSETVSDEGHAVSLSPSNATSVKMAGLGHGRFAVAWVGQQNKQQQDQQKEQSDGDVINLSTFDSLYGVLTNNVELRADAVGARPVQLERSRFTSTVTLATVASVHVFELGLSRSSLCSVLGAHWQTARVTAPATATAMPEQAMINVSSAATDPMPMSLAACIQSDAAPERWSQIVQHAQVLEHKAIAQLSSDVETPDEATFETAFFTYLFPKGNDDSTSGKKRARTASAGDCAASASAEMAASNTLSQAYVAAVVKRSCRSGFWRPLLWLLRRGKVSCNSHPSLMQDLRRNRQWHLLYVALQHVPDVPEREIVDTLLFALGGAAPSDAETFETAFENRVEDGAYEQQRDGGVEAVVPKKKKSKVNYKNPNSKANVARTVQDNFVLGLDVTQRAVLRLTLAACSVAHNEAFLRQHVKRLKVNDIELLLASLCRALNVLDTCSMTASSSTSSSSSGGNHKHGSQRVSFAGLCLPKRAQVVKWICALLDAHFRDLVLDVPNNKSMAQVLRRVQALVRKEAALCDSMGLVGHALDYVVRGRPLPAERETGDYVIERVAW